MEKLKSLIAMISVTKVVLLLIIISLIVFEFCTIKVQEPLNNIALMVVSFYFWQKVNLWSKTYKKED